MPRPIKRRRVCALPRSCEFRPADGADGCVTMTVDELEVLRLVDLLGLEQADCAQQMGVARTTVQAICVEARRKAAQALVEGKTLRIEGGAYELCPQAAGCRGRHCVRAEEPGRCGRCAQQSGTCGCGRRVCGRWQGNADGAEKNTSDN